MTPHMAYYHISSTSPILRRTRLFESHRRLSRYYCLRLSVSYALLSMNFYDRIDGIFPAVTPGLLTCLGDNVLGNGTR
jgi:hypothetical protein